MDFRRIGLYVLTVWASVRDRHLHVFETGCLMEVLRHFKAINFKTSLVFLVDFTIELLQRLLTKRLNHNSGRYLHEGSQCWHFVVKL